MDMDGLPTSLGLSGVAPSNSTMSKFVEWAAGQPEAFAHRYATRIDPLIIDFGGTLVTSHSDKEWAAGSFKGCSGSPRRSPTSTTAGATAPERSWSPSGGRETRRPTLPGQYPGARQGTGLAARVHARRERKPGRGQAFGAHRQCRARREFLPCLALPSALLPKQLLSCASPAVASTLVLVMGDPVTTFGRGVASMQYLGRV